MKARQIFIILFGTIALAALSACSVETFSDFYVVSVSVPKNGVLSTDIESIEILFSKEVDQRSAEETIRIEGDSSGKVPVRYQVSGTKVHLIPDEPWPPYERFWLVVPKETKDIYGKILGEDYSHPFQSTEHLLRVSALLLSPEVVNGTVFTEITELKIAFSAPVERESVEREFSISPTADGYFEWSSDTLLLYHLTDELKRNSFYSIQISASARDQNGYSMKPFAKEFEYFPNQTYPEIATLFVGEAEVFDAGDPSSYIIENGCYIIPYGEAEKDSPLRVDFSAFIDRSTFKENVQISPSAGWNEEWLSDRSVVIFFDEALALGAEYEVCFKKPIKDKYGMQMQYDYKLSLVINGENSQFLNFYVHDFVDLEVSAELDSSGTPINVEQIVTGVDADGSYIEITYDDLADPEEITIALTLTLRFTCPTYTPVLDILRLQDSVSFATVFAPDTTKPGSISSFEWNASNECDLLIEEMGNGNISHLSIGGGKGGVIDDKENYMEQDIEYYFKVRLKQS